MALVLGEAGEELFKRYQDTLKISPGEARMIILKNKTAKMLLI